MSPCGRHPAPSTLFPPHPEPCRRHTHQHSLLVEKRRLAAWAWFSQGHWLLSLVGALQQAALGDGWLPRTRVGACVGTLGVGGLYLSFRWPARPTPGSSLTSPSIPAPPSAPWKELDSGVLTGP